MARKGQRALVGLGHPGTCEAPELPRCLAPESVTCRHCATLCWESTLSAAGLFCTVKEKEPGIQRESATRSFGDSSVPRTWIFRSYY